MSIIRKMFNPKNLGNNKTTMFGGFRPILTTLGSKSAKTWKSIKTFVSRNSNFFAAVGAGTATFLVTKAVSKLFESAEQTNTRKQLKYGSSDPREYERAETRHHLRTLGTVADRMAYMDPESNQFRDNIAVLVAVYNDMIVSLPGDSASFATTANTFYGSMYRLGIQPDVDADDSKMITTMAVLKDNFVDEEEIASDLKNILILDGNVIPFKTA